VESLFNLLFRIWIIQIRITIISRRWSGFRRLKAKSCRRRRSQSIFETRDALIDEVVDGVDDVVD
jgi:hypothetical protein